MIITVILVFFMVISVNRRLFRYFGSYSGISAIPVILVNRRTDFGGSGMKTTNRTSVPRTKIRTRNVSGKLEFK